MTDPEADRSVLSITGRDAEAFLQDLVTNDLRGLADGLVYAALLSPQGKYLADFLLHRHGDAILLDVATPLADGLARRLAMYRLRRDVAVAPADIVVGRGTGAAPDGALTDPRHPAMGWHAYGGGASDATDWTAARVAHCIPASGIELVPDDTYILEAGFERLHGVDFRKGCYVGQEITARMRHKTELRKGVVTVEVDGAAPVGTPILSGDRAAGTLYSQSGGHGIAYLRFDRAADAMKAGDATVRMTGQARSE
jgi:hypothetical protein